MSEQLNQLPIQEVLRPDVTPAMGFQSYEMLADAPEARKRQQQLFMAGEVVRPTLAYPLIDEVNLNHGIRTLDGIGTIAQRISDEDVSSAVWNSAGYRLAEMYWLKEAKRLDSFRHMPFSDAFKESASRYQEMNEQLYGAPDAETTARVFGEIFAQAESKRLDETGQRLFDELRYGTELNIAGEPVRLFALEGMGEGRLPELAGRLDTLKEVAEEEFAPIYALVDDYYDRYLLPRRQLEGGDAVFKVNDMVALFAAARDLLDPGNTANISIGVNESLVSLSWDTPTMSVVIGGRRAAIKTKEEMTASMIHELGIHGGRAVGGLATSLPVLGTGLYTDTLKGEQADYLTFEEGIATLIQMAVTGNTESWKALHISHYLTIALAYLGADYRQAFEMTWRARTLMAVPDGTPITDDIMQKQRAQAYISMVRTRRGTPTEIVSDIPLTFNKDLAYLPGKIIALQFLDRVGTDKALIRQALRGKFDPMNTAQKRIADKYMPPR